ncbi:LCP family protein [Bacillus aquiflavi]|uniref:LCP family protein n=1 Tax=Bacillus aquiflavi TaxID=2672567 RepID=UPI001CA92552|nr:LCP family protein [Bacillus aquiflavi]UAC47857.1 LCP family protein [Bacillus aquiflavi]
MKGTRIYIRKQKKRPFKRFLKYVAISILFISILGLGYGGYLAYTINKAADDSDEELNRGTKSELRDSKVTLKDDPVTILLIGVDDYQDEDKGRADALILVTLNPKTKEVALLSIPRDTRTYIPRKKKKHKINHAYAWGDIEGTVDAVQELLDVPVDFYVKAGAKAFQDIIDEIGGITVNVPFDFKQSDLKGNYVYFKEGTMKLDGRKALAFVQMRYEDPEGDFGRQKREQETLKAIADQALSVNTLPKANKIIESLGSNVKTNISLNEMLGLRNFYNEIKNQEFKKLEIEGENIEIENLSFYEPNKDSVDEVSNELRRILEIPNYTVNSNEQSS